MTTTEQIKALAEEIYSDSKASHDWDHTLRVLSLCQHISKTEQVDTEVLEIATLLHDIGRKHESLSRGQVCHAEIGAATARELLKPFDLPEEKINNIAHCIKTHRSRNDDTPETIEAKILFDADKIDAIGAVGIGRAFLFAGEHGGKLHNNKNTDPKNTESYSEEDTAYREYIVKLQHIKNMLITNEAKKIAQERHDFMETFFKQLDHEINNKH